MKRFVLLIIIMSVLCIGYAQAQDAIKGPPMPKAPATPAVNPPPVYIIQCVVHEFVYHDVREFNQQWLVFWMGLIEKGSALCATHRPVSFSHTIDYCYCLDDGTCYRGYTFCQTFVKK